MRLANREQIGGGGIRVQHVETPVAETERAQRVDRRQTDHEPHAGVAQQFDQDIDIFAGMLVAVARGDQQGREIADRPQPPGGRAFARAVFHYALPGRPEADGDGGNHQHVRPKGIARHDPHHQRGEAGGGARHFAARRRTPGRTPPDADRYHQARKRREREHPALQRGGVDRGIGGGFDCGRRRPDQPGGAIGLHQLPPQPGEIRSVSRQAAEDCNGEPGVDRHACVPLWLSPSLPIPQTRVHTNRGVTTSRGES
ncbi:hypothetical protein D9M73_133140 [compost metagenome]